MAANPKLCSVCDLRHISKPSTDWCSECEQSLCIECKDVHGLLMSSKNHNLIPIADYIGIRPSLTAVGGYCVDHEEQYQLFCQSHEALLCLTCLEEHSECKDVIKLSKMTKDVKTSESFQEAQQSLVDIEKNISKIQHFLMEKINSIQVQKDELFSKVCQIREQINKHLDSLEQHLKKEISDLYQQSSDNIDVKMKSLVENKSTVDKLKQTLQNAHQYGSDLHAFFGMKQVVSGAAQVKQTLESIVQGDSLCKSSIVCQFEEQLTSLVGNIKSFGSVRLTEEKRDISMEWSIDKKAQLVEEKVMGINDIKLKLACTIDIKAQSLTGCEFTPEGRLIICDQNLNGDRVIVADSNGKFLFDISMRPSYVFDVACIDNNTVAVTSDSNRYKRVNIVDIDKRNVVRYIATDRKCCGIVYTNGLLYVCVEGVGIQVLNLKDEKITIIVKCSLSLCSYITVFNEKLFYTNPDTKAVNCCDLHGKKIWTFSNESVIKNPHGISVDNAGNVFVASVNDSRLVVLSPDGQQSRQLLSKEDGLAKPGTVLYDRIKNNIIIANDTGKFFIYDVSL